MQKIILAIVLVLLSSVSACSPVLVEAYVPKDAWVTYPAPMTEANKLEYANSTFAPYPVKVSIDGLRASMVIDTWSIDGKADSGTPDYYWKIYEPLAIAIHNQHAESTFFSLTVNFPADSTLIPAYQDIVKKWIVVSNPKVYAAPNAIVHVPIAIVTPKDLPKGLPTDWEFDVLVGDSAQAAEGSVAIVTQVNVRFLITMGE